MKKFSLVEFSVDHPKLVIVLAILVTVVFMTQFPKIKTDTNPKNMLPATSDVRVWNDEVDKTFGLYEDTIVLGVANDKGVLNPGTLGKIRRITDDILSIKGVAARDVNSFPTITNVTAEAGTLRVAPLMTQTPKSEEEVTSLRKQLFENPLFVNLNVNFVGRIGAEILGRLPGVAASTGSACHAGSVTLSSVLAAMGVPPEEGMGAIRFSLGRTTTWEELEEVIDLLNDALSRP